VLTTDASNVAVAAILTQPDDEGHQHPVAYESRKLTAAEQNYQAHDIHTGIFQGKIKNFPGLETPPVRSSDPTVQ
jgi:hypothetical protein